MATTPFSAVYDNFLSRITDDMYLELTELDTYNLLEPLLMAAIHKFEFPRQNLNDFTEDYIEDETTYCGVESDNVEVPCYTHAGGIFNVSLTAEEINILGTYMIVEWIGYQLASIENTRMKYSGSIWPSFPQEKINFRKIWKTGMLTRAEVLVQQL